MVGKGWDGGIFFFFFFSYKDNLLTGSTQFLILGLDI